MEVSTNYQTNKNNISFDNEVKWRTSSHIKEIVQPASWVMMDCLVLGFLRVETIGDNLKFHVSVAAIFHPQIKEMHGTKITFDLKMKYRY